MARKSKEELDRIKQELNVSELYSWSRYNTWKRDKFEYLLKYIKRIQPDRDTSAYGLFGNLLHDLIEQFYLGEIKKEDLGNEYVSKMEEYEALGLRFDRTDKEKNDKIALKYKSCNEHFLRNFTPIEHDMSLEEYITIRVNSFAFQGYIDANHTYIGKDGKKKLKIIDWKSSTLYVGDKVLKERGQLLLYAYGKMQQGWDIKDITIGWMFTKYVDVYVKYKDGFKKRTIERNQIGSKLASNVTGQLKKLKRYTDYQVCKYMDRLLNTKSLEGLPKEIYNFVDEVEFRQDGQIKKPFISKVKNILLDIRLYEEEEVNEIVTDMVINNSLDGLPDVIKENYVFEDCFVEIPFTMKDIDELKKDIIEFVVESTKLKLQHLRTNDDNLFYQEVTDEHSYFLANLCGYSSNLHKPYADYLEKFKTNNSKNKYDDNNQTEDEDIDMMELYRELGIEL